MHTDYRKIFTYVAVFAVTALLAWVLPHRHMLMWRLWAVVLSYASLFTLLVWLCCRLVRSGRRPEEIALSYTHDGIAIPLCGGFLWMSWLTRSHFFQRACWPMVIGFCIGTGLCVGQALTSGRFVPPTGLSQTISQTTLALQTLWDTKVFLLALGLTTWLAVNRWGRRLLLRVLRRHMLLSLCTLFSLCTLPFAPLGLDKAAEGVCFFCLIWTLLILRQLADKFYYKSTSKP